MLKDKVKELSNLGLKAYAIGAGDEEVFTDNDSSVGDRKVCEPFGVCCPLTSKPTNKQFLEKGNYRHSFAFKNFVAS